MTNSSLVFYIERLKADFGLTPVAAAEIEFYLLDSSPYRGEVRRGADSGNAGSPENVPTPALPLRGREIDILLHNLRATVPFLKCEKERGQGQYEIALATANPQKTADDLALLKTRLKADFSAKPFPDQPGSGLHIHIHLEDAQGKNVFYKDDVQISDALKYSIGGLLAHAREDMNIFAPHPESYARFVPGAGAPTTVSWGANNRTVAVRLPDAPHDNKRIEHRVAGADADPHHVMAAILHAIHDGLARKLDPGEQIYGDASLAMYKLPTLI